MHHRSVLKRAARVVLVLQAAVLGLVAVLLWLPAGSQAQSADAQRYRGSLKREAQRVWGIGAPVGTLAAQVQQESRWHPNARSPVGAEGLAQFMPSTARWMGNIDPELVGAASLNPTWSLRALVVYDHWLHQRIGLAANNCERWAFTLSAYNGGLGWVFRRQQAARQAGKDAGLCLAATCTLNPGISPAAQRENEHYPRAILDAEDAWWRWGPGVCP